MRNMQLRVMTEISRMSWQKRGDPNKLWYSGRGEKEGSKEESSVDTHTEIQRIGSQKKASQGAMRGTLHPGRNTLAKAGERAPL